MSSQLSRRLALFLPLALATCGEPERVYTPLSYTDLPPIQLNVSDIAVQQQFFPAGVAPDVTAQDPEPPARALKTMAQDRLQAYGTSNHAVFAITNASLVRNGDIIDGAMTVTLTIQDNDGARLGFAEARVTNRRTGRIDSLRGALYDMTKAMMDDMNIEFEYQIRQHLKPFLTDSIAPAAPVEQAPLDPNLPPRS